MSRVKSVWIDENIFKPWILGNQTCEQKKTRKKCVDSQEVYHVLMYECICILEWIASLQVLRGLVS